MVIYTNHTRFGAIVTIQIDTSDAPEAALEIGQADYYEKVPGSKGVHDYFVDAGKELRTANNTIANFVTVRNVS
jgi:precorrin-6B methylase 2